MDADHITASGHGDTVLSHEVACVIRWILAGYPRRNEPAILKGIPMLTFKSECGDAMPIRFLDPSCVSVIDSAGNEMEAKKCEKCHRDMSPIIGKDSFMHICLGCQDG